MTLLLISKIETGEYFHPKNTQLKLWNLILRVLLKKKLFPSRYLKHMGELMKPKQSQVPQILILKKNQANLNTCLSNQDKQQPNNYLKILTSQIILSKQQMQLKKLKLKKHHMFLRYLNLKILLPQHLIMQAWMTIFYSIILIIKL